MDEDYLKEFHGITDFTNYQCDSTVTDLQDGDQFFQKSIEGMKRHEKK